jgi:hypothetical protein
MGPGEWISAVAALGGFIGWMTALWVRAGRILQRIDDLAGAQQAMRACVDNHQTRITRLEIVAERSAAGG